MSDYHIPVMLKEVLENLRVKPGEWYVDCNLGGGGHTAGILKQGGKVIGIDMDPEAIQEVASNYELTINNSENGLIAYSDELILVQGNFGMLENLVGEVRKVKEVGKIQGVFYDLGVSSHQLETAERGFSFGRDAPLDMRMDTSKQVATAADLINGLHEKELAELFWKLGEENFSKPIARAIVKKRKSGRIESTDRLAKIILSVRRRSDKDRMHPATRVFQALRIAVNDELNSLRESLPQAWEILEPGGRLVVISFHSLEDRIVKEFMKEKVQNKKTKEIKDRPIEPSLDEIYDNPRARSGKLRVIEKI